MFRTLDKHRVIRALNRLGYWSIPLLSAPLLLPLLLPLLAKSLLPSPQPTLGPKASPTQSLDPAPWQGPVMPVSQNQALLGNKVGPVPELQGPYNPTTTKKSSHQPASQTRHKLGTDGGRRHTASSHSSQAQAVYSPLQPHPLKLEMKVVLANNVNTLAIATSTTGQVLDDAGHVLRSMPAGQAVYTQPSASGIDLNSWQAPPSIWIVADQGGYVYAGSHWYRGRVRLIHQGNSLSAINHVDLEDYLYSVVGSEMPSNWSIEALKAQAVAARSYALAQYIRPASGFYHMGATEAWQVYKGLDGESGSTHQAVDTTAGLFLSYKGGLVESLYASTDEVVIKAHEGRGMSQTGAQKLALQGYDYLHILGAYYPGSGLAQLQLATAK